MSLTCTFLSENTRQKIIRCNDHPMLPILAICFAFNVLSAAGENAYLIQDYFT